MSRKKDEPEKANTSLKIKLRGRDGAPLRLHELQQGFYELGERIAAHGPYRVKWATVYLTAVDENGREVRLSRSGEWEVFPYSADADERGL